MCNLRPCAMLSCSPTSKENAMRSSIRNAEFSRRALRFQFLQNYNPERNALFKQQNNLQGDLKSVKRESRVQEVSQGTCISVMLGLRPVININAPLQPLPAGEVSKWLQCSLNINNLNLQMHRRMGTRLGRLCFLALYGNFQRKELQPTI